MIIREAIEKKGELIKQLYNVWEKSVRATHTFLAEEDIQMISRYVPPALKGIPHLLVAWEEKGEPAAFLGATGRKVEMLFVLPERRRHGIGKQLWDYGREKYSLNEVCVNEQNPQARKFYERMGFSVYKRTEFDEQGNPFPLLYMRLI